MTEGTAINTETRRHGDEVRRAACTAGRRVRPNRIGTRTPMNIARRSRTDPIATDADRAIVVDQIAIVVEARPDGDRPGRIRTEVQGRREASDNRGPEAHRTSVADVVVRR